MKNVIEKIKNCDYNNVTPEIVSDIVNDIKSLSHDEIIEVISFMIDDVNICDDNAGKDKLYESIIKPNFDSYVDEIIMGLGDDVVYSIYELTDMVKDLKKQIIVLENRIKELEK